MNGEQPFLPINLPDNPTVVGMMNYGKAGISVKKKGGQHKWKH